MYPQRLPRVDDDDGIWGDILLKYLTKEHYNIDNDDAENGGHKNVTIRPGTAGAGGAPLKFTSGTLLTTPEVGAMEFAGDNLYLTQTSGATRKKVALYDDASGATGDMYYRNSSGSFTRLAAGAASQILTISGGIPTWQTPSSSSTFSDATFTLQDDGDATKQARFQLSGITTATTRTYTLPNATTTLVGDNFSQTLSNKTLTAPRFASGGFIADNSGNEQIVFTTTASAVNEIGVTNAAAGVAPQISARGGDTNVNLNLTSKGTGRVQANGVDIPTVSSSDTLINKTINGGDNTITNIPWAAVSKPAVIAAGATVGAALSNVNLTEIVGGSNTANGRTLGAYARNALYSHPESQYFVPIPHAYNDIAYNNIRGGSVEIRVNGSVVAANGNNAGSAFGPDAVYEFADYYSSTSDTVVFEVTLHRTFQYGYCYGIQQADWFRGQNITFEAYNGSSWSTLSSVTNQTTGLTWNQADAGGTGITKLRITLTNFNSSTARITQIFLIGFNSDLLSGTFLPRGGGRLYGDLQAPGVRIDTIRDGDHGIGILDFYGLPSAVNYLQIQNRATGAGPGIYAQGADTNIDINLVPKGTGTVRVNGNPIDGSLADGSVTSAKIADGTIMNADVNASAGIAVSKLGTGRVDATVNGTATNTSIWRGTQAQYDAIGSKDSNTIYFITS